jgi:uncharacterized protein (TIGR02284 family)
MSEASESLSDLVSALNDGIAFYEEASRRISNSVCSDIFSRLSAIKSQMAAQLNAEIVLAGSEPQSDSTWLGSLRLSYADMVANFADHPRYSFVEQVTAQKSRVQEAFLNASQSHTSAKVREIATSYLPRVQRMHDEISELKNLLARQVNQI